MNKELKLEHDLNMNRIRMCYDEVNLSEFEVAEIDNGLKIYKLKCSCGDVYEVKAVTDLCSSVMLRIVR